MRIKNFNIIGILFFPNILNPFIWLAFFIMILHLLFISWWKRKIEGKYVVFSIDKDGFRTLKIDLLCALMVISINSIWWNKTLTANYVEYLKTKWFSREPEPRKNLLIKQRHEHYLKQKLKKWN